MQRTKRKAKIDTKTNSTRIFFISSTNCLPVDFRSASVSFYCAVLWHNSTFCENWQSNEKWSIEKSLKAIKSLFIDFSPFPSDIELLNFSVSMATIDAFPWHLISSRRDLTRNLLDSAKIVKKLRGSCRHRLISDSMTNNLLKLTQRTETLTRFSYKLKARELQSPLINCNLLSGFMDEKLCCWKIRKHNFSK